MSKYNYASAETIVNMIREKALACVEETSKDVSVVVGLNYIAGAAKMANIIIDEMQKEDDVDGQT